MMRSRWNCFRIDISSIKALVSIASKSFRLIGSSAVFWNILDAQVQSMKLYTIIMVECSSRTDYRSYYQNRLSAAKKPSVFCASAARSLGRCSPCVHCYVTDSFVSLRQKATLAYR
jgi:hypothetical protein